MAKRHSDRYFGSALNVPNERELNANWKNNVLRIGFVVYHIGAFKWNDCVCIRTKQAQRQPLLYRIALHCIVSYCVVLKIN